MGEEFTLKRETEMGRLFNMTITCRSTGISCLPLSILLLSGCVNLTGIQDFALASAESAAFHGISDDFGATLERRAVMAPDGGDCERVLAKFASAGIDVDVLAVATATRYRCAPRQCCLSTLFLPQRSSPRRPPS